MNDLEERLRRAGRDLPALPDRLDDVRRRGRRRRTAVRAGAGAAALTVLALAGVLGAQVLERTPSPVVGDGPPETPAPETPSPAAPAPSPSSTADGDPGSSADTDTVSPDELGWVTVTHGADGVRRWGPDGPELLAPGSTSRVVWLPEHGAVGQSTPGAAIVPLGPGDGDELVGARDGLLLRAGGVGPGGAEVLLVTWTRPASELGPEIVLAMVDVGTREVTELGVVGNSEDGPDALAVDGDELAIVGCHLQCSLRIADVASPIEGRELARADWRGGVAVADGVVATVGFGFDPELGRPESGRLVLHDRATGSVLAETALPDVRTWDVRVSLSPDGAMALVTVGDPTDEETRSYVVDGLPGAPRVRELTVRGGALFTDG